MILKKQTFVDAINAIDNLHKEKIDFAQKMAKCFPNSDSSAFIYDNDCVINALIAVLQEIFNDKNKHSWIEYFLWDLDFGRENWRLKATDENRNEIPMASAEQLYDFLSVLI